MSENDDFTHVQRRLCAVIAKSEWTSSRMRMQKGGEELRERRAKSHRTANKFLQELLDKRTDGDLIDDNGAVDRYNKFVKHKSALNDDTNNTLDEFDRRLRALNNNRRNQSTKVNNQNIEKKQQQETNTSQNHLQSTSEVHNDKKEILQQVHNEERSKPSRILPSLSIIPVTSTPNDTTHELLTPVFHDDDYDDNQELSNVQSTNISLIDSQTNHIESPVHQHYSSSSSLDKTEPLNLSTTSLNHSTTQTLYTTKAHRSDGTEIVVSSSSKSPITQTLYTPKSHRPDGTEIVLSSSSKSLITQTLYTPKAHRPDGTEIVLSSSSKSPVTQTLYTPKARRPDGTEIVFSSSSSKSPIPHTSANVLLFNHCYFPRSLTSHGKIMSTSISKRQLPSLPILQTSEQIQSEQFDTKQLFHFLDHLNNDSNKDFKNMLDQLSLSTVIHNNQNEKTIENTSFIDNDDDERENIFPNLFEQSSSLQEERFYTTFSIDMDNPKDLILYTMTLGTVQLSASILLPYSILNGRRPLVKCSSQTDFKQIRSKREKYTCQVTAIESLSSNIEQLKQNDIILKINDQSVWRLTLNEITDIFEECNTCSVTIARLCQPFV